jgi:hypothetical protein
MYILCSTAFQPIRRTCTLSDSVIAFDLQAVAQLQQQRGFAAKDIQFGTDGRASILAGVERLANAVQVTLGPKVNTDWT